MANICAIRLRRHKEMRAEHLNAYEGFFRLNIDMLPVDHAELVTLADHNNLTACDAA